MTNRLRRLIRNETTASRIVAAVAIFGLLALGGVRIAVAQSTGRPAAAVASSRPTPLKLGVTFTAHSMLGALVMDVQPGSPAAKAGLQPGDRILEANGRPISGAEDAVRLVNQLGLNSPLHMLISREGRRRVLETTLTPWQANSPPAIGPAGAPAPNYYAPFPQGFPFQLTPADIDDQHAYGG
ncbi:MAG TPA: PDZ domain-containing protein [Pirellulales bacterium]|jgi:S1-C subfamily serine protease|nr:PDZ domain-containing protein [Pirellulales bacterium]